MQLLCLLRLAEPTDKKTRIRSCLQEHASANYWNWYDRVNEYFFSYDCLFTTFYPFSPMQVEEYLWVDDWRNWPWPMKQFNHRPNQPTRDHVDHLSMHYLRHKQYLVCFFLIPFNTYPSQKTAFFPSNEVRPTKNTLNLLGWAKYMVPTSSF